VDEAGTSWAVQSHTKAVLSRETRPADETDWIAGCNRCNGRIPVPVPAGSACDQILHFRRFEAQVEAITVYLVRLFCGVPRDASEMSSFSAAWVGKGRPPFACRSGMTGGDLHLFSCLVDLVSAIECPVLWVLSSDGSVLGTGWPRLPPLRCGMSKRAGMGTGLGEAKFAEVAGALRLGGSMLSGELGLGRQQTPPR